MDNITKEELSDELSGELVILQKALNDLRKLWDPDNEKPEIEWLREVEEDVYEWSLKLDDIALELLGISTAAGELADKMEEDERKWPQIKRPRKTRTPQMYQRNQPNLRRL